jgi:hypothetical protein
MDCRFDREWLARLFHEVASKRRPNCSVKAALVDPLANGLDCSRMALHGGRTLYAGGSDESDTLPVWHPFTNTEILDREIKIVERTRD